MAYDETLTDRLRKAIGALPGLTEKRMMGGVCFILDGNMVCGADRAKDGTLRFMFRIGKGNEASGSLPAGEPVVMAGKLYRGFYFVDAVRCDNAALKRWVAEALHHARSLPPK